MSPEEFRKKLMEEHFARRWKEELDKKPFIFPLFRTLMDVIKKQEERIKELENSYRNP